MHSGPNRFTGDPSPGEHIEHYEVLRSVARGGMASVLAVRDTQSGEECAMKLLLPLTHAEEALSRFRREFRALSRLNHSGILNVKEWGMYGDRPWFTMELLAGRVLRDEIADWKELDPVVRFGKAENVLMQLTRALAYVHDRGLIHRDLTPANIMILPDGKVKLMDFGVVKDMGADVTAVGEVVGTVAYIAPEQIHGEAIDARADLYSLGAVLYLMLTGKRPFSARTLQGFLEKHLTETPKAPCEADPLVPLELSDICMRLLSKDPKDRYASAIHLLHVLGKAEEIEDIDELWPPRSVGRTYHKARIREMLDDLAMGKPGAAMLIAGAPGQGKTRLLDLAETYGRGLGLIVARGRCRPHDRPFGAFVGVYRALAGDDPPEVLRATLGGEEDERVRERYPVIAAFKDMVVSRAPVLVLLDDAEHAEPATIELLTYLIRNTLGLQSERVAFLISVESRENGREQLIEQTLRECEPLQRSDLEPLAASDVEELVLSMLPNDDSSLALAARLHSESNGSPAFVADMLRGLVDEGLMVEESTGHYRLTLDAGEITRSRLPVPASLRQALQVRLAPLPPAALEVAHALAISRRHIDLDHLVEVCDLDEEDVMEAVDLLIEEGIVDERREGELEQVDLAQGRFRDVLLGRLAPQELRQRHQRHGEVLERAFRERPTAVVEELAFHFEKAGLAPKAYAYLVLTAHRHLNRSLYAESLAFLDRAIRMEPTARPLMLLDDADKRLAEVHLARSKALYHLGDWTTALASAHTAEKLARDLRDPHLQSMILAELGSQLRNQGAPEAEAVLREAIDKADHTGDTSLRPMPMYQLGGMLWAQGDLDAAEQLWREVLTIAQRIGDDRSLGYGYNGLGILAICRGNTPEARSYLEQSAALFSELGMLGALSIARVNLVELYLSTGILRKALALADRTVSQAREVHLPHGIAIGLAYRAQVLLELGRLGEALQNARESLRLVRQLGTTEDELVALGTLARVDLACDHPANALRRIEQLLPLLEEQDPEGMSVRVAAWRAAALALLGRHDEGVAVMEHADLPRRWPHIRVRTNLARAKAWRLLHRPDLSKEIATMALEEAEANGYRFFQLEAHHMLVQVEEDTSRRSRHARTATSLARSLAANLPREDAALFLERRWGESIT